MGALALRFAAAARRKGLPTNEGFSGFSRFDPGVPYAQEFADAMLAPGPRHIVMCHPGHPDAELAKLDAVVDRRRMEYDALMRDVTLPERLWRPRAQRRRPAGGLVAAARVKRVSNWSRMAPGGQHPVKHGLGFLFSGGLGVPDRCVRSDRADAARHAPDRCAPLCHIDRHGGGLARAPPLHLPPLRRRRACTEFLRYAAVGWTVAAINYGIFVLIVLLRPSIEPLYALFASSLVAMVFAYLGMRFAAFRKLGGPHE